MPTLLSRARLVVALSVVLATAACSGDDDNSDGAAAAARANATTSTTAVTVEDDAPLVVAVGDIVCVPGMPTHLGQCQHEATAQTAESLDPVAVLGLGDLQYERGEKTNFEQGYDKSWGRLKDITKPSPGNHEWSTPNLAGYRAYFPEFVDAAKRQTWYSFDIGEWHLISLDSNCRSVGGCQPGSPQEQWLRADLAKTDAECILAFMHHPRWSSGPHGSDDGYDFFWQALSEAGADIVLGGHDHHYERFAPERGIRQFVVGTGGRSIYPTLGIEAGSEVRNSTTFGVLALKLGKAAYSWRFVPSVGGFTDQGSATC